MTRPTSPNPRPSGWAVALLVFSSAFAAISFALLSTSHGPF